MKAIFFKKIVRGSDTLKEVPDENGPSFLQDLSEALNMKCSQIPFLSVNKFQVYDVFLVFLFVCCFRPIGHFPYYHVCNGFKYEPDIEQGDKLCRYVCNRVKHDHLSDKKCCVCLKTLEECMIRRYNVWTGTREHSFCSSIPVDVDVIATYIHKLYMKGKDWKKPEYRFLSLGRHLKANLLNKCFARNTGRSKLSKDETEKAWRAPEPSTFQDELTDVSSMSRPLSKICLLSSPLSSVVPRSLQPFIGGFW